MIFSCVILGIKYWVTNNDPLSIKHKDRFNFYLVQTFEVLSSCIDCILPLAVWFSFVFASRQKTKETTKFEGINSCSNSQLKGNRNRNKNAKAKVTDYDNNKPTTAVLVSKMTARSKSDMDEDNLIQLVNGSLQDILIYNASSSGNGNVNEDKLKATVIIICIDENIDKCDWYCKYISNYHYNYFNRNNLVKSCV